MERKAILERLRAATEDDVERALGNSYVEIDEDPSTLLEFFNRMVDVVLEVEGDD